MIPTSSSTSIRRCAKWSRKGLPSIAASAPAISSMATSSTTTTILAILPISPSRRSNSAKGENVLPDRVESRDLALGDADELAAARARLMAALGQTGRKKAAMEAAKAQTSFDCWLEMTEDEEPPEEIVTCKGAFEDSIAQVERALTRDVEDVYLVFFAWDQATLTPVALTVLDQVQADFALGKPVRVIIAGHADRSGPESYNQELSERRARAVAQALGQRGIAASTMKVEAYGETQPRVPTADGVREPQNRRVEIVFG